MKAELKNVWRGSYKKRLCYRGRQTKTIQSPGFFNNCNAALLWAEITLTKDGFLRVVRGSAQVEEYSAMVVGERRCRFFLVEEQFVGLPGFIVYPRSCSFRNLVSSMKNKYYIETTAQSFCRVRLWNGKGKKPINCLVLVGKVYYRLGAEISVE